MRGTLEGRDLKRRQSLRRSPARYVWTFLPKISTSLGTNSANTSHPGPVCPGLQEESTEEAPCPQLEQGMTFYASCILNPTCQKKKKIKPQPSYIFLVRKGNEVQPGRQRRSALVIIDLRGLQVGLVGRVCHQEQVRCHLPAVPLVTMSALPRCWLGGVFYLSARILYLRTK